MTMLVHVPRASDFAPARRVADAMKTPAANVPATAKPVTDRMRNTAFLTLLRSSVCSPAGARAAREHMPLVAETPRRVLRKGAAAGRITDVPEEMKAAFTVRRDVPSGGDCASNRPTI